MNGIKMDETCLNCGKEFEKKKKGFKRKSIDSVSQIPAFSFRKILNHSLNAPITPDKKLFICDKCASVCVKVKQFESSFDEYKSSQSKTSYLGKRTHSSKPITSTPSGKSSTSLNRPITPFSSPLRKRQNVSTATLFSTPRKQNSSSTSLSSMNFVDKAVAYIKDAKYYTAFRILFKKSKAAKAAFVKLTKGTIQSEVKSLHSCNETELSSRLSQKSIENFSWKGSMSVLESNLPVLTTAVKAALTTRKSENKLSFENRPGSLVPAYGFILSSMLHLRMPARFCFLQEVLSVEMYRSGCNQKLFKWLNKLGFCRSVTGTRAVVDRICLDFDQQIKTWKNNIQHDLGNFNAEEAVFNPPMLNQDSDGESTVIDFELSDENENELNSSLSDAVEEEEEDELEGIIPLMESSAVINDDNDVPVVADVIEQLDPGYSLCWDNVQKLCAARHRSGDKQNKMMLWALAFATRNRISFRHLDYDTDTKQATDIPLEVFLPSNSDWEILRERMRLITKRILVKNFPAFKEADVEMNMPHQYSKESALKSEIVNLGVIKENPSTCKGVIEIMKELHKYVPAFGNGKPYQIICHGDQLSIERMVDGQLSMAPGSEDPFDKLAGLVPRPQGFHKRNIILQDAMNEFYKSPDQRGTLMQIRNKFEFRNVKKKTSDCINDCVDFWNFVTEGYICLLACKICDITSLEECPEDLLTSNINAYVSSLSEQIISFIWPTILCSTNPDNTLPYSREDHTFMYDEHDNEEDDGDDGNEGSGDDDDDTSDDNSETHEAENRTKVPDDDDEDHVFQHSCGIVFTGLKMLADKDAERQNDGEAMVSHWKINMCDFWNHNHNKYLILGHRLISAVNGWLPKRLQQDIIWNSTANLTGEPSGNLALDLVNEFQNNDFKGNLKNSHGQYSDNQISRCSKITGSLGKGIEEVFQSVIMDKYVFNSKSSKFSDKRSVAKFVNVYFKENLFFRIRNRCFKGFENYMNVVSIKKPEKLQMRLTKYSINLDKEKYACEN